MGILSWLIFGLIVGALAKWIMPGSFIGIGSVSGFNFGSIIIAVAGALLLLWLYKKFKS
jgi:uncharacterized membrane protein YeaQ/YmgE (transglycosylase-associated protein family)